MESMLAECESVMAFYYELFLVVVHTVELPDATD